MNNLNYYIQEKLNTDSGIFLEKLRLDKNTKVNKYHIDQLNNIDNTLLTQFYKWQRFSSSAKEKAHWKLMKETINKHKSAKELVKISEHDPAQLFKKWWASIIYEWDEGILEFGNALCNYVELIDLHKYIVMCYKATLNHSETNQHYQHYLELYELATH